MWEMTNLPNLQRRLTELEESQKMEISGQLSKYIPLSHGCYLLYHPFKAQIDSRWPPYTENANVKTPKRCRQRIPVYFDVNM